MNLRALVATALLALGIGFACSSSTHAQAATERLADPAPGLQAATFAGGCFWCMEPPFEKLQGVKSVISGYTGGKEVAPSYKQVSSGATGHTEAVRVTFDPKVISYDLLLEVFWRSFDPTDAGGQFADRGPQYRPEVFYHSPEQMKSAKASKDKLARSGKFDKPIAVPITAAGPFYAAEDYHQDYYKTNPGHYKRYRVGSGREGFLKRVWGNEAASLPKDAKMGASKTMNDEKAMKTAMTYGKPSDAEIKEKLNDLQYRVTQHEGTEPPFKNEFWDNKKAGIYVDIVSGEPLFSSTHKFKSGTGWPSFTQPLEPDHVVNKEDRKLFMTRIEVRSKHGDSHLGHVFDDGPAPTGLRYCINSAALRFIPKEDLVKEGYAQYAELFN